MAENQYEVRIQEKDRSMDFIGCSPESVFREVVDNGFSREVAKAATASLEEVHKVQNARSIHFNSWDGIEIIASRMPSGNESYTVAIGGRG